MRIRTMKPEFWSHPVMVRQDDATKLLALGLLNYSDDEGYFYAEPAMVRAALRPLDEDSTIIRRLIARLSEMGYIETFEHHSHGSLGRIVSFSKHQRVDRPTESKIRVIWGQKDSSNNRRTIVEQSPLEGKGKEQGTGKGTVMAFEEFWKVWPKKKAKEDARKAFIKAKVPVEQIITAVQAAIRTLDWQKDNGRFIPHAATWLNGQRWNDEIENLPAKSLVTAEDVAKREAEQAEIVRLQTEEVQRLIREANA